MEIFFILRNVIWSTYSKFEVIHSCQSPDIEHKIESSLFSFQISSQIPVQPVLVQSQQWKLQNNVFLLLNILFSIIKCRSANFVVDFEQISHIVLVFPLLTLNK